MGLRLPGRSRSYAQGPRVRFAVPVEERSEFLQRLRTLRDGMSILPNGWKWNLCEANETGQQPNSPVPSAWPWFPMPRAAL